MKERRAVHIHSGGQHSLKIIRRCSTHLRVLGRKKKMRAFALMGEHEEVLKDFWGGGRVKSAKKNTR